MRGNQLPAALKESHISVDKLHVSMKSAGPAVIEGEGLGEGLANDVACLVRIEEFGIKRNDFDCEGGALGGEVRIEGFQMKEYRLFGLEHLFCALAGNGDDDNVLCFHT